MKLNAVVLNHESQKLWCGIIAIAGAAGISTEQARLILREAIGEKNPERTRKLKGVYTYELSHALHKVGISHTLITLQKHVDPYNKNVLYPSIARFLLAHKPKPGNLFMIFIARHVLLSDGVNIMDTYARIPTAAYNYPLIEKEVEIVWELNEFSCEDL